MISDCEGWKTIRDFGTIKLEWLRKFLPSTYRYHEWLVNSLENKKESTMLLKKALEEFQ